MLDSREPIDHGQLKMTEKDFRDFSDLVYRVAGIHLHDGKRELLQARVGKIIRRRRLGGFRAYFNLVREDRSGAELTELLNAVSTNLTYFFREEKHFQFLGEVWLPALQRQNRSGGPVRIRGWCAACSTGEEPYSIMITLLEKLGESGGHDIRLMNSDISTRVLEVAQRGVYAPDRVRTVPAGLIHKYFEKFREGNGTAFHVRPLLSERMLFRRINLMEPLPFRNPLDFIFCRNVMIYFDKNTQQGLVKRLFDCLRPGGYLFIGHSESLSNIEHPFQYVAPAIYRRA